MSSFEHLGLPRLRGPLRFAIGHPSGLSSNSWRVWSERKGDVYLACRDNYKEIKVSLHPSGKWRMGFTNAALGDRPDLLQLGQNRAWEVWEDRDEPVSGAIRAFQINFLSSELAVEKSKRPADLWNDVIFIEEAPNNGVVVATLWIKDDDRQLVHSGPGPHATLAILQLPDQKFLHITVHGEDYDEQRTVNLETAADKARQIAVAQGMSTLPPNGRILLYGHKPSGVRFITEVSSSFGLDKRQS